MAEFPRPVPHAPTAQPRTRGAYNFSETLLFWSLRVVKVLIKKLLIDDILVGNTS